MILALILESTESLKDHLKTRRSQEVGKEITIKDLDRNRPLHRIFVDVGAHHVVADNERIPAVVVRTI